MKWCEALRVAVAGVALISGIIGFWFWQQNDIVVSRYTYESPEVPPGFDGYTILQVSDIHNKAFGKNQSRLLGHTRNISPDIIVYTGDTFYEDDLSIEHSMEYVRQAADIAPLYFVSGNHDLLHDMYPVIVNAMTEAGAHVIDDKRVDITKDGESIRLLGVKDPAFGHRQKERMRVLDSLNGIWDRDEQELSILLCHRPEVMDIYVSQNIDLAFTGHAHGGLIRIPFVGGLFVPYQGLFPKYDAGMYREGNTTMVLSRGLGSSWPSIRTFNRPELAVVTLRSSR